MARVRWLMLAAALAGAVLVTLAASPSAIAEDGAAPDFTLPDAEGEDHALADYRGKWVVLEWVNHGCPFVKKHYHPSHRHMQTLQAEYTKKGVVWLSICSSAEGKQGHMSPTEWQKTNLELMARPTAVLLDEDGTVGRAYGARTTPEIRIIDPKGRVVYAGAIDDVRGFEPEEVLTATNYVETVLDAALAGKQAPVRETKPYGCSVKYAPRAETPKDDRAGDDGRRAPEFTLTGTDGEKHGLKDFRGKWVVLEWINLDCPFVRKHYHPSHRNMQRLQAKYAAKDVVWVLMASSAPGKQGHLAPDQWRQRLKDLGARPAHVLLDPKGEVGRAYGARTTPDMRIIDPKGRLVYEGAIDDTRSADPEDVEDADNFVEIVLDAVLAGKRPPVTSHKPYGCSVKYP